MREGDTTVSKPKQDMRYSGLHLVGIKNNDACKFIEMTYKIHPKTHGLTAPCAVTAGTKKIQSVPVPSAKSYSGPNTIHISFHPGDR